VCKSSINYDVFSMMGDRFAFLTHEQLKRRVANAKKPLQRVRETARARNALFAGTEHAAAFESISVLLDQAEVIYEKAVHNPTRAQLVALDDLVIEAGNTALELETEFEDDGDAASEQILFMEAIADVHRALKGAGLGRDA